MRWLREPLLHFLVLGAGIFTLFAVVRGDAADPRTIVVTPGTIQSLAASFERTWQRPPTGAELDGLVDDWVRGEILAREATNLGLDRDDVIVRRRLRQKMELLAANFAESIEASDADLEAWLHDHPDRYRIEPHFDFAQVYLNRERRGEGLERDAARMLQRLRAGGSPAELGDPLPLPPALRDASRSDVARLFGEAFAAHLAQLPAGAWSGPVESSYGAHLVRVEARREGRLPALDEVREAVLRDWQSDRTHAAQESFYASLRAGYKVVVQQPGRTPGTPTAAAEPR